jgi:N-methylhydantoinase A
VLIEGQVTDERLAEIEKAFHETYEREYTYRLDAPVEMVGIHLVASAEVGKLTMRSARDRAPASKRPSRATATSTMRWKAFSRPRSTTALKLEPGMTLPVRRSSRIPARPSSSTRQPVSIDGYGNIHIRLGVRRPR